MSIHFIAAFCATVFVASIIPGPSMLLALTHGMKHGAGRTMASALGNVAVTMVQALVSIVGLGTVLLASETVFMAVKWAGAAYLVYMGISILLSPGPGFSAEDAGPGKTAGVPLSRLFLQSAMVTAGNPKAIVFFTAVFPQFIHPESGYLAQCGLLLFLMALIAFACFMLYALCGQKIVAVFSRAALGRWIKRAIGTGFLCAGIGLAASRR